MLAGLPMIHVFKGGRRGEGESRYRAFIRHVRKNSWPLAAAHVRRKPRVSVSRSPGSSHGNAWPTRDAYKKNMRCVTCTSRARFRDARSSAGNVIFPLTVARSTASASARTVFNNLSKGELFFNLDDYFADRSRFPYERARESERGRYDETKERNPVGFLRNRRREGASERATRAHREAKSRNPAIDRSGPLVSMPCLEFPERAGNYRDGIARWTRETDFPPRPRVGVLSDRIVLVRDLRASSSAASRPS